MIRQVKEYDGNNKWMEILENSAEKDRHKLQKIYKIKLQFRFDILYLSVNCKQINLVIIKMNTKLLYKKNKERKPNKRIILIFQCLIKEFISWN